MDYNHQKYVISLDAVDLNFVPINLKRSYDRVVPIWTKGNLDLRDDDYYEFEIRNEEKFKELQTDKSSSMQFVMCHICNLKVPNMFLNEHNLSDRHKINMKIVNISLNKVKEAINMPAVVEKEKDQNVFFCASCVAIVNINDKMAHESTVAHMNSENIVKMMRNFVVLFSNNDNSEDIVNKCESEITNRRNENIVIQNETTKPNNLDDLFNKLIKAKRSCQSDCDKINSFEQTSEQITQENILDEQTTEDKLSILDSSKKQSPQNKNYDLDSKNSLDMYIDVLNKSNNLKMPVTVLDENNLKIVTPEGTSLKISENNFHSFKNIDDEHILCLLCQEVIETQKKEQHILCKLHMERVCVPFKDQHCVRQISHTGGCCTLCNKEIENPDLHILSNMEHDNFLEKALLSDTEETSQDSPRVSNGDVREDITANKLKKDLSLQSKSDTRAQTLDQKYCEICDILLSTDSNDHSNTKRHKINMKIKNMKVHYLMKFVNNYELECAVCLCCVSNNLDAVESHLISDKHAKKYKSILAENKIVINKNCTFYCNICKIVLNKIEEIAHIYDSGHKKNMNEFLNLKGEENSILSTSDSHVEIFNIPSTSNLSALQHSLPVQSSNQFPSTSDLQSKDDSPIPVFKVHHHMLIKKDHLHCIVCDMKVMINKGNMNQHIKGYNHTTNYKEFLSKNFIEKVNGKFKCKICSMNDLHNEITHCTSIKHLNTIDSIKIIDWMVKNKSISNIANLNNLIKPSTSNTPEAVNLPYQYLKKTANPKEMMCIVCEVKIPNTEHNIKSHLQGMRHSKNYENYKTNRSEEST